MYQRGIIASVVLTALLVVSPSLTMAEPMDEIIVTAQKRAEDVRDVPIAISVVSSEMLKTTATSTFNDLAKFLPNVSINTDFNSFYMRGIGSAELNVIGEQAVSYVIDDMYVPRLEYVRAGFMDVKSIEVLKGPQGTLYGRNATAGVINISTEDPGDEIEVLGQVSVGVDNFREYEAVLSAPITDRVGFRMAGKIHSIDGPTYSRTSQDSIGDRDYKQVRGKLKWNVTDTVDATLTVSWFTSYVGVWLSNEVVHNTPEIALLMESLDPDYEAVHDRQTSLKKGNKADNEGWMVPLEISWDIGEFTLSSVSAFARINDDQGGDIDATNADLINIFGGVEQEQFSQELRLLSPPGEVEFVGGIYYLDSETTAWFDLPAIPDGGAALGADGLGGVLGPLFGLSPSMIDSLLMPIGGVPVITGAADTGYGNTSYELSSLGVFGQVKWNVSESFAIIGGLRYSEDTKIGSHSFQHGSPLPVFTLLTGEPFEIRERELADSSVTPKVSTIWHVSDEITSYLTYAEGFRSGSFNIAALRPEETSFEGEKSRTFETGLKTRFLSGALRVNLGLFYTTYEDYQLATFNGFGYVTANAEEVESMGVEGDFAFVPFDGLFIAGSVGYNRSKFVTFPDGGCVTSPGVPPVAVFEESCDLSGKPLHRSPEWNGSLRADYRVQPMKNWPVEMFVGGDAGYKGFEYFDSDLDPLDSQEGHWLYNARMGFRSTEGHWAIEIHGKNLSDELVKTFGGDVILQAGSHAVLSNDPRQFFLLLRAAY